MAYEPYITQTDYDDLYKGAAIAEADFDRIALRASDEIDKLTFGRIRSAGLDSYDDDVQESIKLATCAVAEALAQIDTATDGTGLAAGQEKVGSYSYSVDPQQLTTLKVAALTTACSYLRPTGLLYAGI
jgi:hypothetical protein